MYALRGDEPMPYTYTVRGPAAVLLLTALGALTTIGAITSSRWVYRKIKR